MDGCLHNRRRHSTTTPPYVLLAFALCTPRFWQVLNMSKQMGFACCLTTAMMGAGVPLGVRADTAAGDAGARWLQWGEEHGSTFDSMFAAVLLRTTEHEATRLAFMENDAKISNHNTHALARGLSFTEGHNVFSGMTKTEWLGFYRSPGLTPPPLSDDNNCSGILPKPPVSGVATQRHCMRVRVCVCVCVSTCLRVCVCVCVCVQA